MNNGPKKPIGTYEQGDAAGRAVVRTAIGFHQVQLKRGVRKRAGELVTQDEIQPQP